MDQPSAGDAHRSQPGVAAARISLLMLLGVPVGIVFQIVWAVRVKTSPMTSSDDRIRGWGTVVRELPATLFLVAVVGSGFLLAVRAGRQGAVESAERAVWIHGAVLFFVLLIVLGGSTENIMTTRPATVKWLLFPVELGTVAVSVSVARHAIRNGRNAHVA